jgi:hypothetical protein
MPDVGRFPMIDHGNTHLNGRLRTIPRDAVFNGLGVVPVASPVVRTSRSTARAAIALQADWGLWMGETDPFWRLLPDSYPVESRRPRKSQFQTTTGYYRHGLQNTAFSRNSWSRFENPCKLSL